MLSRQSAQNEALARVASAHRSTPDLTLQGRARDGPTWPISMPSSRRASKSEQSPDESNRAQPALPPVGAAVPSPTRNGGVPSADAHVQPSPRQRTKSHSAQRRPSLPAHMPGAPVVSAATEKSNELLSFHAQQARAIASAQAQAGFPVQVAPMAPGLFGAPIGVDPRWFASLSPEQQWEMQQHHQQAAAFAQEQYRRYMATVIQGPSSSSSSSSRSRAPDDAWETATTPVNAGQHPNGHAQPGRLGRRATASAVGPNGRPSHGFRQPIAPHPGAGPSNSGEVMIRPYPTPSRAPVPSLSESARVSMGPSMSRPYHRSGHGHGHGHGQARGLPGSSSSTGLLRTPSARFMMPPSASQPSAGIIPDMPPMPTSVSGQGANGGHTDAHAHTGPEV